MSKKLHEMFQQQAAKRLASLNSQSSREEVQEAYNWYFSFPTYHLGSWTTYFMTTRQAMKKNSDKLMHEEVTPAEAANAFIAELQKLQAILKNVR